VASPVLDKSAGGRRPDVEGPKALALDKILWGSVLDAQFGAHPSTIATQRVQLADAASIFTGKQHTLKPFSPHAFIDSRSL
jgi:hypothetical protein